MKYLLFCIWHIDSVVHYYYGKQWRDNIRFSAYWFTIQKHSYSICIASIYLMCLNVLKHVAVRLLIRVHSFIITFQMCVRKFHLLEIRYWIQQVSRMPSSYACSFLKNACIHLVPLAFHMIAVFISWTYPFMRSE